MIEKRARKGETDIDEVDLAWRASVERDKAEHHEALLWQWRTYHQARIRAQKAIFTAVVASHERAIVSIEKRLDHYRKGE